ncbi:MAG: tail fiber protein [Alphaproteobacteria bacterium]|jgi:hypothetical protein|nr:tail fiber protein [Alphaproteobacteria bacterium]
MSKDDHARTALSWLNKKLLADRLGLQHRTVRGWGTTDPIPHCHRPLLERFWRILDRTLPKSDNCIPTGTILHFPEGANIPINWINCDGRSLLRKDYPELFAVIGTIYGSENERTFSLPIFPECYQRQCIKAK